MTRQRRLKLGVAGLGRGFMLMLPTLAGHPRLRLTAAADPRPEARHRFEEDFAARSHADVADLCADPEVEAVYIATPHPFHVAHVRMAAAHGKHILVEKPMALTLEDCRAMIDAAAAGGVHLIVGHSHSFDAPVLRARAMIASGAFGRVRMITAMNFTDFLYRPRRPEELDTARGGGVVFSQAAHQVDVVRLLAGGDASHVLASTGAWDPARPTEGAYSAHLRFADGAFASLTYNGYGHFDTDEFCGWVGELGQERDPAPYGTARAALAGVSSPQDEAALKNARAYGTGPGGLPPTGPPRHHNHFGLLIASCERADLRPTADGVLVYGDRERYLEPVPLPPVPRAEVIDELCDAVLSGCMPLHDGAWGMATTRVCLAMLRSAREGREVALTHPTGMDGL